MTTFTDPRTDETFTFPVRLPKQLAVAAIGYGLEGTLANIDDVADIIDMLDSFSELPNADKIGTGEEPEDDLYRLCVRIRNAWQAQNRY